MNFSDNTIEFCVKFYFENQILDIFFKTMYVIASKWMRKIQKMPNILYGK